VSDLDDITCREVVDLVTEYLEGAMPAQERTRFEQHLVYCVGCENYLSQMRQTVRVTGSLPEDPVPDEAMEELLRVFRDFRRGAVGGG
jgi:hypothetical protein